MRKTFQVKIFPPSIQNSANSPVMDEFQKKWFLAAAQSPGMRSARRTRRTRKLQNVSASGHRNGRGRRPSYRTRIQRGTSKQIEAEVIREARVALLSATWRLSARREAVFALLSGRQTTFQLRQQYLYADDMVPVDSDTDSDVGSESRHRSETKEEFPFWMQDKSMLSHDKKSQLSSFETVAFDALRELDMTDTASESVLKNIAKQLKHFAQTLAHVQASSLVRDEPNDKSEYSEQNENGLMRCKPPSIGARRTASYRAHAMKWLHHLIEEHGDSEDNIKVADEPIVKELFATSDESRAVTRTFSTNAEASDFLSCDGLPASLALVIQGSAREETQRLLKLMAHPDESIAKTLIQRHGGAWNALRAQLDSPDMVAVHDGKEGPVSKIITRAVVETFNNSQDLQQVSFPDFVHKVSKHAMRPTEDEILQAFYYFRQDTYGFQVVWRLLNLICGTTDVHQRDAVSVTANLLKESGFHAPKQKEHPTTDTTDNEVKALQRLASMTIPEIRQRVALLSFDDAVLVKRFAMGFVLHDPRLNGPITMVGYT